MNYKLDDAYRRGELNPEIDELKGSLMLLSEELREFEACLKVGMTCKAWEHLAKFNGETRDLKRRAYGFFDKCEDFQMFGRDFK